MADELGKDELGKDGAGKHGVGKHGAGKEAGGYARGLKPRQVRMIAIGGAIGTGLFLGAGGRLHAAGPGLVLVFLLCGIVAFLILRALGELVTYRPVSGSFVEYAREFMGEEASFVAGWMYAYGWALTGIADITAAATYMRFWHGLDGVPQWVWALAALGIVGASNLVAVRWFGELEFGFSLLKVGAICIFLLVGVGVLATGYGLGGHGTGFNMVAENGGVFPHGVLAAVLVTQGVLFAYSGIEVLGIAAGEAEDAERVLPRAINGVIWRIGLFYVGSVLLLGLLLPFGEYRAGTSPFVTFFGALGLPGAGTAMNVVVLTAALSSLNSGLYGTGRVLKAMADGGSAPRFMGRMSRAGVPAGGIAATLAVYAVGVGLNAFVPEQVFELVLNVGLLGVVSTWGFIVLCQWRLRRAVRDGRIEPSPFPMPGAPWTGWFCLAFLLAVLAVTGCDWPRGTAAVGAIPAVAGALWVGWRARGR